MKFKLILTAALFSVSSIACAGFRKHAPLKTAQNVSLEQYVGKWYAVTSLPQIFTRRCVAQTADYALTSETSISVLNTCIRKKGKTTDIDGEAQATDVSGVFSLQFDRWYFKLFGIRADYNIIKLDPQYRYALIGGKNRKSLWLLSRTKTISDEVYNQYVNFAKEQGFDVSKLVDSQF